MTQFRYLATDVYQFRRQSLSFLRFLKENGATVLFTSENSPEAPDEDLQFLSDGIIELNVDIEKGRSVKVTKFRGSAFRTGRHREKFY
jgi:circadian clock protein KaiC